MTTTRDLVQAQGHVRRRLLSALVSGPSGIGNSDGPSRSRPVVVGVVLGALLLGAGQLTRFVERALPDGWDNGRVVVGATSGARFVGIDGVLHAVANMTSARLILPSSNGIRVQVVDDAVIAGAPRGRAIGILGAPDDVPPATALVPSGWVSCLRGTSTPTTRTTISATGPAVTAPTSGAGVTVAVPGTTPSERYLVAHGRRYAIPATAYGALKQYLDQPARPRPVPKAWVGLLTAGSDLSSASFHFPAGSVVDAPLSSRSAALPTARVGQLLSNRDRGESMSVLLADGTVPLTPFAAAVYRSTAPASLGTPVSMTDADLATILASASTGFAPSDWPSALPTAADENPCIRLVTYDGKPAATELVLQPDDSTLVGSAGGVAVTPGQGSLFRVGSTPGAPVYVVDQSGQAFRIADPTSETLSRLGYGAVSPRSVPTSWLALFATGPVLSEAAVHAPSS